MTIDEDINFWKQNGFNVVAVGPDVPIEARKALKREGFKVLDHNWEEWRKEPEDKNSNQKSQHGPRNRWGQLR